MSTSLMLVERELLARHDTFAQVLPAGMMPDRLIRTVLISCERTPKLLECTMPSLMNSALTAAVLGLEVDGVTGQAFLVPYRVKGTMLATCQIGYKGYSTIAARSRMSLSMNVAREGDHFDYDLGTRRFIEHKPLLEGRLGRKIVAGYAIGTAYDRPSIFDVMPYADILAIRERSKAAAQPDSPWNDTNGPGHEAMCAKTVARRLGRSIPIVGFQWANAMESAHDLGHAAYLRPDGAVMVDGDIMKPDQPPSSPFPERAAPITDLDVETDKPRRTAKEELAHLRDLSPTEALQWEIDNRDRLQVMQAAYPDAYEAFMVALVEKRRLAEQGGQP